MNNNLRDKYEQLVKRLDAAKESEALAPPVANLLLVQAIQDRASDIHIEPKPQGLVIRFRIDGLLHEVLTIPSTDKVNLVACFKVMAGIDVSTGGSLAPKDGRIDVRLGETVADVRMNVFPTLFGEKAALRILVKSRDLMPLHDLGFYPQMLEIYRKLIRNTNGMILVTGPTGSGKTTTLYITLAEIFTPGVNVCTLEDPIEYEAPDYNQAAISVRRGLTFAVGLRALLRQDPNIILVGEIRDEETAEVAIRAALTGHLIFSTLHTNDAGSTVARLYDMGIDPYLIANCLRGVVSQRLARTLCKRCIEPDTVGREWFERNGLLKTFPDPKVSVGRGCDDCRGTGVMGRIGLFELLVINEQLRKLISAQASRTEIAKVAASLGMPPLRYDGLRKVADGLISLEEALKLTAEFS